MTKTPLVDAHHHFLDPTRRDYYWMGGDELYCKLSGMVTEADWNGWKFF